MAFAAASLATEAPPCLTAWLGLAFKCIFLQNTKIYKNMENLEEKTKDTMSVSVHALIGIATRLGLDLCLLLKSCRKFSQSKNVKKKIGTLNVEDKSTPLGRTSGVLGGLGWPSRAAEAGSTAETAATSHHCLLLRTGTKVPSSPSLSIKLLSFFWGL